ncbi:hypothetical protein D3C78_1724680 [compost metagenome]
MVSTLALSPAVTRLPAVIMARLARPSIGAITRVKSRFSCAMSNWAWAAKTLLCACAAEERRCSHTSVEIAWLPISFSVRLDSLRASAAWLRARTSSA